MVISACEYHGCTQSATYDCCCEGILLCSFHCQDHLEAAGSHNLREIQRRLNEREDTAIQQASGLFRDAIQNSFCDTLETLSAAVDSLVLQKCWIHSDSLKSLQITFRNLLQAQSSLLSHEMVEVNHSLQKIRRQECDCCNEVSFDKLCALSYDLYRKANILKRVNKVNRDLLLELNGVFEGLNPSQWIANCIKVIGEARCQSIDLFNQAHKLKAQGLPQQAIKVYRQCARIQEAHSLEQELVTTLYRLGKLFEGVNLHEQAAETYLEAIRIDKGRTVPRSTTDFKVLLQDNFLLNNSKSLSFLLEDLDCISGEIQLVQAYEAYLRLLSKRGIQFHFLTQFAQIAFEETVVDVAKLSSSDFTEKMQILACFPVSRVRDTVYRLDDDSLVLCLVAKQIIVELNNHTFGQCLKTLNRHNLVDQLRLQQILIELMKPSRAFFERILMQTVLESRVRNDGTRASANAITILNQMNSCFAGQNLRLINISGANLTGADLTKTNLSNCDLSYVVFRNCKLLKTKFHGSILTHTDFGKRVVFTAGSIDVTALCFSNNGSVIASGDCTGQVSIWTAQTGQLLYMFRVHCYPVTMLCFSPDDSLIAVGGDKNNMCICRTKTGYRLLTLPGNFRPIKVVCFSPCGTLIVTDNGGDSLILREVTASRAQQRLGAHKGGVTAVCFCSQGLLIGSGGVGKVGIWEVATGRKLNFIDCGSFLVSAVRFPPSGERIIASYNVGEVAIWCIVTGQKLYYSRVCEARITNLIYSPDDTLITVCCDDSSIYTWDSTSSQSIQVSAASNLRGTLKSFTQDGNLIAVCSTLNDVVVWNADMNQSRWPSNNSAGHARVICFSFSSHMLASSGGDKLVMVWKAKTGRCVYSLSGHSTEVKALSFSPDDKYLASSSEDRSIILWDLKAGQQVYTLWSSSSSAEALIFSHEGTLLFSVTHSSITAWDRNIGQELWVLTELNIFPFGVKFCEETRRLCAVTTDLKLIFWDIELGSRVALISLLPMCDFLSSSANNTRLVFQNSEGIAITNALRNQTVSLLPDKTSIACLSNDGKLLVSAYPSGEALIWDATTGQLLRVLQCQLVPKSTISFSPDIKLLAMSNCGLMFSLWKTKCR